MISFRTKEEYEAWKAQRLKEVQENRKKQPQVPIESAADSKTSSQTRMMFSDVLPLLLLGVLAAVLVFSVFSPVLNGR
jgi:dynactin complex subunit